MKQGLEYLKAKYGEAIHEMPIGVKRTNGQAVYSTFPTEKALKMARQFGWEPFTIPVEPMEAKPAKTAKPEIVEEPKQEVKADVKESAPEVPAEKEPEPEAEKPKRKRRGRPKSK